MARRSSRLQKEIAQSRPFRNVHEEALLSILKTADVVRRSVAASFEPHGITPQQYNVLRILRGAGAEALPARAIAERLIEETPGMTRLLDRLEAKRLIRRTRCLRDRRQVLCQITDEGLRLLALLGPVVKREHAKLASGMKAGEAGELIALLEKARECFGELPQEQIGKKRTNR